jgi:hypothetical protein
MLTNQRTMSKSGDVHFKLTVCGAVSLSSSCALTLCKPAAIASFAAVKSLDSVLVQINVAEEISLLVNTH